MKVRRTLSGILFGLGCALTFIGLLTLILPAVANDQLRLVLASFEVPSENPVVQLMNSGMSFALHHSWHVLFTGAALLVIGLVGFILFSKEKKRVSQPNPYKRPVAAPAEPLWEQPAPAAARPNPFADMALWDQQFAPAKKQQLPDENPFSVYGGPMLERNRVEETPSYSFTPEAYARPAEPEPIEQPEPAPEPPPVAETLQPLAMPQPSAPLTSPVLSAQSSISLTSPTSPISEKPEPVYTPNEEPDAPVQISSRIRSTMGRHREW